MECENYENINPSYQYNASNNYQKQNPDYYTQQPFQNNFQNNYQYGYQYQPQQTPTPPVQLGDSTNIYYGQQQNYNNQPNYNYGCQIPQMMQNNNNGVNQIYIESQNYSNNQIDYNIMNNQFQQNYVAPPLQAKEEEEYFDPDFKPEEIVEDQSSSSSEDDLNEYEPEEPIDPNSDNNFNLEDYLKVRNQL